MPLSQNLFLLIKTKQTKDTEDGVKRLNNTRRISNFISVNNYKRVRLSVKLFLVRQRRDGKQLMLGIRACVVILFINQNNLIDFCEGASTLIPGFRWKDLPGLHDKKFRTKSCLSKWKRAF